MATTELPPLIAVPKVWLVHAKPAAMSESFSDTRSAALALLNSGMRLTRKAGSFCGQLVADPSPLSDLQRDWLYTLLERAELPPLVDGAAQ